MFSIVKDLVNQMNIYFHVYIILCFGQMESQNLFIAVGIFFKFMLIMCIKFCFQRSHGIFILGCCVQYF